MTEFTVAEQAIPREVGAEGWGEFVAMTQLRNTIEAGLIGTGDLSFEPEELLPRWLDPNDPKRLFLARVDGVVVGRAMYEFLDTDDLAWVSVEVLEEFRGRGIGTALYDVVYEIAALEGKTTFQTEFFSRADEPGERIPSPSGFGSMPAEAVATRFATARGYGLQLVLRNSRLTLPVSDELLEGLRSAAESAAGDDYRIVRWEGPTPELWLDDSAVLRGRMFTDAPHGDLDMGAEVWDAARVKAMDAVDAASPGIRLVAAIEHIPTARLVAFSELVVPPQRERPIHQRDTLVLAEHRGHRLGLLLKVDNIAAAQQLHPGHPSITTTNAEENEFMLAVNEAVGFVPIAYAGVWKYEVTA